MFAQFIELHFASSNIPQEIQFFIDISNSKRTKAQPSFIKPFFPSKTIKTYPPNLDNLPKTICNIIRQI